MVEKKISYEAARDELAEVVSALETGSATLEESLKLWERGEELAKIYFFIGFYFWQFR